MSYLLDTNAVSGVLRGNRTILARVRHQRPSELAISAIVMAELWGGALHSPKPGLLQRIAALTFTVLPFDEQDAQRAGEVRAQLLRAGTPISPFDVLIAGQALARELTLVTHNTREFVRVPGLRLEDWET